MNTSRRDRVFLMMTVSLLGCVLLLAPYLRQTPTRSRAELSFAIPAAHFEAAKQAKESFERGNYREAEKLYEEILAVVPNNLYVLSNLGMVRFRSHKFKLAEETFQRAIALSTNDAFSHCTLGIVYYSQGKYDEAIKSLQRAIELEPKNATAHNYLGIVYSQKGMQAEPTKEVETLKELEPAYDAPPQGLPKDFRINEA